MNILASKEQIEAVFKPTHLTEVSLPSFCADALEALDSIDARSFVEARVAGAIIYIWWDNETSRLALIASRTINYRQTRQRGSFF